MTHEERAKIVYRKLRGDLTKSTYEDEIALITAALVDAAAEASEVAVKATVEKCAVIAEDYMTSQNTRLPEWIAEEIRKTLPKAKKKRN